MIIYEIDERYYDLIDPETGEVLDYAAFAALQAERDEKIEDTALWYKELVAEAKAIREEEIRLAKRRRLAETNAEKLKGHLNYALAGEKFRTAKVDISYKKSTAVEIKPADEAAVVEELQASGLDNCLIYSAPRISKTELAKALKAGVVVPGAELVERNNIQVR